MITSELIQRGGSKLEITRLLIEKGFKHVPESVFLYAGQNLGTVKSEVESLLRKGRVICRGSHPNDYHGFVDVVPTTKNITSFTQLEKAVKEAEEFMQKPEVKRYSELNDGQPYEPVVHFLIQQQSKASHIGQVIEHPHRHKYQSSFLGNALYLNNKYDCPLIINFYLKKASVFGTWEGLREQLERHAQRLLSEIVPEMKFLGVLDDGWAQNIEFSLEDELIFQARPFKKFQKPVRFKIELGKTPHLSFNEVLGITPKTGISLPCVQRESDSDHLITDNSGKDLGERHKAYALHVFRDKMERKSSNLEMIFQNMHIYYSNIRLWYALGHAHYRFMKKAEYSFFDGLKENDDGREILSKKYHTYISNGKEGVIVPTEYLK